MSTSTVSVPISRVIETFSLFAPWGTLSPSCHLQQWTPDIRPPWVSFLSSEMRAHRFRLNLPSVLRLSGPPGNLCYWQHQGKHHCNRLLCQLLSHARLFVAHGLYPTRLLCSWNPPGMNTGVSCHFLLQGIFPGVLIRVEFLKL